MSSHLEKEELLTNVVRLRNAQMTAGGSDDLRAVRSSLERRLGPTVKRALAARALGVSQPALDRWIESGDIPTVPTPQGRWEVPSRALAGLVREVEARKAENARYPLASVLRERRRMAETLDVASIVRTLPRRRDGHRGPELRSLAYHRAVAQRLNPEMVQEARHLLAEWVESDKIASEYAERWSAILSRPLPAIARAISRDDQLARDLRQNSPFAGALTQPERRRLLSAVA